MRLKVEIGADERVALPPGEAEALGVGADDELEILTVRGAFAVLTPPRGRNGAFAGTLSALTIPEVVQTVVATLKTGVLLLAFGADVDAASRAGAAPADPRRKSLYFREGQLVFASSTEACDRLGAVLWRHGLLDAADRERCGRLVAAGRPLGQVLVDEGVLSSGQLYAGMSLQVREILLGAFLETDGQFVFIEGPYEEQNTVKLPERTRDLLLEGMKRIEEVERLLSGEVPDLNDVLAPAPVAAPGPGRAETRLLAVIDGLSNVREVIAESELGLYSGLRALAALVRVGAVTSLAPRPPEPQGPSFEEKLFGSTAPTPPPRSGPFETYRRIFKRVFDAIERRHPDARDRLNSYFERLSAKQRPLFEGARIDEKGEMDVAQVLVNVSSSGAYQGGAARARSLEALEDFLAFALFEAKNVLPRQEAEALLREVGKMQVGKL